MVSVVDVGQINRLADHGSHEPQGLYQKFLEHGKLPYEPRVSQREVRDVDSGSSDSCTDGEVLKLEPGPDIEWLPSYETYVARVKRLAATNEPRSLDLPEGYPKRILGPRCWTGSDFVDKSKYIITLSQAEIDEVEQALQYFITLPGRNGHDQVCEATFPLPTLGDSLRVVSRTVHSGRGFAVIRGLQPDKYSRWENITIYAGITSYIAGRRGCQDTGGSLLLHLKDVGNSVAESEVRQSPYTKGAQPFHNDVCDILAMYVLETADAGGESVLASNGKIYNEIAASRPDVIKLLNEPSWVFDKSEGMSIAWRTRPILFNFKTHGPGFCYSRRQITGSPTSPRVPGVPPMTEEQAEALDMVHFTGAKHKLEICLKRGDIQLINNLAVFHARNDFSNTGEKQRHIMRMWLRDEGQAWQTPEALGQSWFRVYGNSEVRSVAHWNMNPSADRERVISRKFTCS